MYRPGRCKGTKLIDPFKLPAMKYSEKKSLPSIATVYFFLYENTVIYVNKANNLVRGISSHHLISEIKDISNQVF